MSKIKRFSLPVFAAALLIPGAGGAAARSHHRPCSRSAGPLSPRIVSPCDRATVTAGRTFTFKVHDTNSKAHKYPPFINLALKRPKHGPLKNDNTGKGIYDQMHAVRGHPGTFTYKTKLFTFPGFWLVTPGTYYVQIQQVDCTVRSCNRDSPIETIKVR